MGPLGVRKPTASSKVVHPTSFGPLGSSSSSCSRLSWLRPRCSRRRSNGCCRCRRNGRSSFSSSRRQNNNLSKESRRPTWAKKSLRCRCRRGYTRGCSPNTPSNHQPLANPYRCKRLRPRPSARCASRERCSSDATSKRDRRRSARRRRSGQPTTAPPTDPYYCPSPLPLPTAPPHCSLLSLTTAPPLLQYCPYYCILLLGTTASHHCPALLSFATTLRSKA